MGVMGTNPRLNPSLRLATDGHGGLTGIGATQPVAVLQGFGKVWYVSLLEYYIRL